MPTQNEKPDVPRDENAKDATYGGFARRLSYDRIVKRMERRKHREEGEAPEAPRLQEPRRKKGLAITLSLLALGAATVLAVGLWLWLR